MEEWYNRSTTWISSTIRKLAQSYVNDTRCTALNSTTYAVRVCTLNTTKKKRKNLGKKYEERTGNVYAKYSTSFMFTCNRICRKVHLFFHFLTFYHFHSELQKKNRLNVSSIWLQYFYVRAINFVEKRAYHYSTDVHRMFLALCLVKLQKKKKTHIQNVVLWISQLDVKPRIINNTINNVIFRSINFRYRSGHIHTNWKMVKYDCIGQWIENIGSWQALTHNSDIMQIKINTLAVLYDNILYNIYPHRLSHHCVPSTICKLDLI